MTAYTRLHLRNHTASLLSRKWTLYIIKALGSGVKRYSELSRLLPGVTQKVLTETLREMKRTGLIHRSIRPTVPLRVEYQLTVIGLDLTNLSNEFASWFDTHHEDLYRAQNLTILAISKSHTKTCFWCLAVRGAFVVQ